VLNPLLRSLILKFLISAVDTSSCTAINLHLALTGYLLLAMVPPPTHAGSGATCGCWPRLQGPSAPTGYCRRSAPKRWMPASLPRRPIAPIGVTVRARLHPPQPQVPVVAPERRPPASSIPTLHLYLFLAARRYGMSGDTRGAEKSMDRRGSIAGDFSANRAHAKGPYLYLIPFIENTSVCRTCSLSACRILLCVLISK
jgi:hypothetical protein